jgi:hypothetical protein
MSLFALPLWAGASDYSGWGDPATAFERRPCYWLVANAREILSDHDEDSIEEIIARLDGHEERMAIAIDLTAKDYIGDIRMDTRPISKVTWSEIPGFDSETAWQDAQERYAHFPEDVRDGLARLDSDPTGFAFPMLQTSLLVKRIAELRYERDNSTHPQVQGALFKGRYTHSIYLVGPQPEALQANSFHHLSRDRKETTPLVLMASSTGKVRHRGLRDSASVIRFDLSSPENPIVDGGNLHFNTPLIRTWGNAYGAGEWEASVRDAVISSLEHGQETVRVWVPLALVGNGAYIRERTNNTHIIPPGGSVMFDLYPASIALTMARELGAANRAWRPAVVEQSIQAELKKLAFSLVPPIDSETSDYRGELKIRPLEDLEEQRFSLNHEFRFSRPRGQEVIVHTHSAHDALYWLELTSRFMSGSP